MGDGDQNSKWRIESRGKENTEEQGTTKGTKSLKHIHLASDQNILPPLIKMDLQCRLRIRK